MTEEMAVSCTRPSGGPVGEPQNPIEKPETNPDIAPKELKAMIQVGQKAPDFSAPGYQQGKFINVKLSNYFGKWVLLCLYPGDFTFV